MSHDFVQGHQELASLEVPSDLFEVYHVSFGLTDLAMAHCVNSLGTCQEAAYLVGHQFECLPALAWPLGDVSYFVAQVTSIASGSLEERGFRRRSGSAD